MNISVLIAENHTLIRQGLAQSLDADEEITVVGAASNGWETLAKAQQLQPDVVLINTDLPGMDGNAMTLRLKEEVPSAKVVLLSLSKVLDDEAMIRAVQAGARGYVTQGDNTSFLIKQLKHVAGGGLALSEEAKGRLMEGLARRYRLQADGHPVSGVSLSPREREVLALICLGYPNKQISTDLFISENTVRAHVRSLMQKVNLDNRTQLAIYAIRQGLDSGRQERTHHFSNGSAPAVREGAPMTPPVAPGGNVEGQAA